MILLDMSHPDRYDPDVLNSVCKLFAGWEETLIWSALQGVMGQLFVDSLVCPQTAMIIVADFTFFAGRPRRDWVEKRPGGFTVSFSIFVARQEEWNHLFEVVFGKRAKRVSRYAFYKDTRFDVNYLESIVQSFLVKHTDTDSLGISSPYVLLPIGRTEYLDLKQNVWSCDLVSQFPNSKIYEASGLGYVIYHEKEPVAGCSSYTVYRGGLEIEVDTRKDFRRCGLAKVCCASLILRCIELGLYPSWDAQNPVSAKLAKSLGYKLSGEYIAYEIYFSRE